jgi:hypothetical protein
MLNPLRKKRVRVDIMLNPLRKKRVRVDTMPNSLLKEINSFRGRYHSLVAGKH